MDRIKLQWLTMPLGFVAEKSKENEKLKSSVDKEGLNEPDYDKDEGQEEETGEITTNQVF
jgi:hypothetical protein